MREVHEVVDNGGRVLIPVFALGRAQELCVLLETYWRRMGLTVPINFSTGGGGGVTPLLVVRGSIIMWQYYLLSSDDQQVNLVHSVVFFRNTDLSGVSKHGENPLLDAASVINKFTLNKSQNLVCSTYFTLQD